MMRSDALTELDALAQGLLGTRSTPRSPQFMPVDVYRMEDRYFVHADLPGMDPGSIDVNMGRGVLTLTAHRSSCLLYTSPSPRDRTRSRMPSSA